jgi:hypothetical protein
MTVIPIRPDEEEHFTPITVHTVHEVYYRPGDCYRDLDVESGHNPLAGFNVRLEHHELSAAQALLLADNLRTAAHQCLGWTT